MAAEHDHDETTEYVASLPPTDPHERVLWSLDGIESIACDPDYCSLATREVIMDELRSTREYVAALRRAPPLAAPAPSAMATGEARAVVITERREIEVKQRGSCACCAAAAWWPGDYAVELNVTSTLHEHHGQIVVWTIKRFCTDVCRECGKLPIAELEDRLAARWQMRSRLPAPLLTAPGVK